MQIAVYADKLNLRNAIYIAIRQGVYQKEGLIYCNSPTNSDPGMSYIDSGITDKEGKVVFRDIPPDIQEVFLKVEGKGYIPKIEKLTVPRKGGLEVHIGLEPVSKGSINLENQKLRALIRASTSVRAIQSYVEFSKRILELSPDKFKKDASNQLRKTSEGAHKRIEELHKMESLFSISSEISMSKLSFKLVKSEKKKLSSD